MELVLLFEAMFGFKTTLSELAELPVSDNNNSGRLRVLAITNLFPNSIQPHAAAFNRQQLGALSKLCSLRILATVPRFPFSKQLLPGSAATRLASLPATEKIDDLTIEHPRTFYLPSFGRGLSAFLHAASLKKIVRDAASSTDVIFGAWVFPDGIASIMLGKKFDLPVVVKCFGSDINTLTAYKGPAWNIRRYLPDVDGFVAVSNPLKQKVIGLGVAEEKISVVIDGINRDLFYPREKADARAELGIEGDGPIILYVGRTELTKGLGELLDSYPKVLEAHPNTRLIFVGSGAADGILKERAKSMPGDIRFMGARLLDEIPTWVAASDIVTLPSYAEGLPNTVLEALACGRPVVATNVGGIPDVLTEECGQLVPPKDVPALAGAFCNVLSRDFDPVAVSNSLPQRDWDTSAAQLLSVLEKAAGFAK